MKVRAKQFSLDSTVTPASATIDIGSTSSPLQAIHSSEFVGELTGAVRFKAKNETGSTIVKGSAVYINGVSGDVPTIALADSDISTAMPSVGLAETSANNNAEVYIVSFGNLTGLDTSTLGTVGQSVYIDTTAGALTTTPPSGASSKLQNIGQIIRVHATEGIIKVGGAGRTAATPNLDEGHFFLGDSNNNSIASIYQLPTSISGTSGQVLTSNGTDVVFQASGGGGFTGNYESINNTSSPVTAEINHHYGADSSNGAITFNLPTLSGLSGGEEIRIKLNTAGNNLTITANGSDTIEGSGQTYVMSIAKEAVTCIASSGTNWEII